MKKSNLRQLSGKALRELEKRRVLREIEFKIWAPRLSRIGGEQK